MTETKIIVLLLIIFALVIPCNFTGKANKNINESNTMVIKNQIFGINDTRENQISINSLNEKKINDKEKLQECKPYIDNFQECNEDNKCVKCNENYYLDNSNTDNPMCINIQDLTDLTNMLEDSSIRRLVSLPSFDLFNLSLFNFQEFIYNITKKLEETLKNLNISLPSFNCTDDCEVCLGHKDCLLCKTFKP